MTLDDIDKITTKDDFACFVEKLREHLQQSPEEWENVTLESFLEAMEAWVRDIDGYIANSGDKDAVNPSWKTFAKVSRRQVSTSSADKR